MAQYKTKMTPPKKGFSKKYFYLAALALAFLFLAGCTGEMSRTEKNICYTMATKSYAYVPVCETENSCYEKVDALFKTNLGYVQEGRLYEFKNRVARSWFFYNKATLEAKKLAQYCSAGNVGALAGTINQIRNYIDNSFLELDQGIKVSFSIIAAEEKYLTEQKIDLAKEEATYESVVELRQILSELKSGATNSDSYVSYYLLRAQSYANSTASKESPPLIEKTPFWITNSTKIQDDLLAELNLGGEKYFAFLTDAFRNSMNYFEQKFYTNQALLAVQNLPINEYMKLYSDLGGTNNSSLKRFADLMTRISKNKDQTSKNAANAWEEIETKSANCKTRLEQISKNTNAGIVATALSFNEIKNEETPKTLFIEEIKKIILLKEEKIKGSLTLGEELSRTKEIANNLTKIQTALKEQEELTTQKLGRLCDNSAQEFKKSNYFSEKDSIKKLIADADYYASKTINSSNTEKIDYCKNFIEKNDLLQLAFKEYSLLEAKKKDSAKECFEYLSGILPKAGLNELNLLFEELKKQEVTKENLIQFEENCLLLKEQVNNELAGDETTKNVLANYVELKNNIEKIQSLEPYAEKGFQEKFDYFKLKYASYSKYFNETAPNYLELIPVKEMLDESIKKTVQEAREYFEKIIIEYAKTHTKIVLMNETVAEVNKEYKTSARIIIPNPSDKITKEFNITLNTNFETLLQKDECVKGFSPLDENTISISLSCLEFGSTTAEFLTTTLISKTEKDEIIFASNEESLLRRTIALKTGGKYNKCLIKTTPPKGLEKNTLLINEKESLGYFDPEGNLSALIENCSEETKISIIFYVTDLLISSTKLIQTESSFGKELVKYDFVVINTIETPLSATLLLNIPTNNTIEKIEVLDEGYNEKKHEIIGEKIVLRNQSFMPLEEKKYLVRVTVNSAFEYYFEELKKQADEFFLLGDEETASHIKQLLLRKNSIGFNELILEVEKNSKLLNELNKKTQSQLASVQMKSALLENIKTLRKTQKELTALGLTKQAKEIEDLLSKVMTYDLNNYSNVVKAFDLISKNSFSVDNGIKKKLIDIAAQIAKMRPDTNNPAFLEQADALLSKKQAIEELLAFNPAEAINKYLSLEDDFNKLLQLKAGIDLNLVKDKKEIEKAVKQLYEDCKKLLNYLEETLAPNESQLIKLKILPPITESRLKSLALMIEESNNSKEDSQTKLTELGEIKIELTRAADFLKRQAITAFNRAIDLGVSNTLLSNAKEMIDSNRYADALILFQSNGESFGLFQTNNLLFFIPVLLVVGIAFLLKQQFGKKEKEAEEKKQIIFEAWKD